MLFFLNPKLHYFDCVSVLDFLGVINESLLEFIKCQKIVEKNSQNQK